LPAVERRDTRMKLYLTTIINRRVVNGLETDKPTVMKFGVVAKNLPDAVRLASEYYKMDWDHYVIESIRESPLVLLTD